MEKGEEERSCPKCRSNSSRHLAKTDALVRTMCSAPVSEEMLLEAFRDGAMARRILGHVRAGRDGWRLVG